MSKKIHILLLFVTIVIFIYVDIVFNIFGKTFNFADNFGYAKSIELFKLSLERGTPFYIPPFEVFLNNKEIPLFFISPLFQTITWLFSYIIPAITVINILIILSSLMNLVFSYIFFMKISENSKILAIFGSIIFGTSSLVLYGTWINLMGLFFLPLILNNIYASYCSDFKDTRYFQIAIYSLLFFLSSTYFIPILFLVIFAFFASHFKKKSIKYYVHILSILLLAVVAAFIIYKIPFFFIERYGTEINIANLVEKSELKTSIDPLTLLLPNNNNIFTNFQFEIFRKVFDTPISYFRYSLYFPVALLCAFILAIVTPRSHLNDKRMKLFSIIIIGTSFIIFLGEGLKFNGISYNLNAVLYYIKLLPYGEIFRKSAYFFYPLTLGIAIFIIVKYSQIVKKSKKYYLILAILTILTLLGNLGPYRFKSVEIMRKYEVINSIQSGSTILLLPNTGYNNWEFQYYLMKYKNNFRTFDPGNATLPGYSGSLEGVSNEMNNLFFNPQQIIEDLSRSCNLEGEYVILFKKYIENFFGFANKSTKYDLTKTALDKCNNVNILTENEDFILYTIK